MVRRARRFPARSRHADDQRARVRVLARGRLSLPSHRWRPTGAQFVYQTVSLSVASGVAAQVRFDDIESLAARVGVRIAKTWALDAGSNAHLITAWIRPNVWREFLGNPSTEFSSATGFLPFRADIGGNWAEINAGVSASLNRTTEVYANIGYQEGFDGRSFA